MFYVDKLGAGTQDVAECPDCQGTDSLFRMFEATSDLLSEKMELSRRECSIPYNRRPVVYMWQSTKWT